MCLLLAEFHIYRVGYFILFFNFFFSRRIMFVLCWDLTLFFFGGGGGGGGGGEMCLLFVN
jgi:hypothetical protein